MNFTKGMKVYVHYDPQVSPSFTEELTIQKLSGHLLYFEEKAPYYAVEYKKHSFYAFSNTIAGNVLIVQQLWQLPYAKLSNKFRCLVSSFRKSANIHPYGKELNNDTLSTF